MKRFRQANVGFLIMMLDQGIGRYAKEETTLVGLKEPTVWQAYNRGTMEGYTTAYREIKNLVVEYCLVEDSQQ